MVTVGGIGNNYNQNKDLATTQIDMRQAAVLGCNLGIG